MNVFDYFFENTSSFDKQFLVGKEEITYKELYSLCLDLSGQIKEKIGENKHILLLSTNNLFFLKAYLAILKSGNICIPLDPGIEPENFTFIKDQTKPELIFLTWEVEKRLNLNSNKSIFPDTIILPETWKREHGTRNPERQTRNAEPEMLIAEHNTRNAASGRRNHELFDYERCAEIIFTSGSTGKPKGVMISHKNIIANTGSIVEYLKLSVNDRMLVVLPFYYCYGLSLLHTHLRVGGSIVLNNSFIFIGGIIRNLLDYKCTGFAGVPSHFQILLRKSYSFKETVFPDLKYVTQAGGKLASIFIDEFREKHPEVKFIVMYGQTEATARLSWLPPELYNSKKGSIGKGIPGVELKVISKSGKKIKPGETGEVIAMGDNIMMGYFADEEATKTAIRNGWLYTGDLGTVDEENYIYLTARSKEIIKVRGKRISPKEIEAVILALPEVIDCTIEGIEDDIEGEMLKATLMIKKDHIQTITRDYLIRHCSKHLSLFKVPQVYDIKHDLTISPTGKKIK